MIVDYDSSGHKESEEDQDGQGNMGKKDKGQVGPDGCKNQGVLDQGLTKG